MPSFARVALISLTLVLLLVDAGLVLWRVRHAYFVSIPPLQYITVIWGVITGFVALVSAAAPGYRILKTAITGQESEHKQISVDRVILMLANAVVAPLRRPSVALPTLVALAGLAVVLVWYPDPPKSPRTSSGVLAVTVGHEKLIYVADPEHGQILVFRSSDLTKPFTTIPIGSHGNVGGRGKPENMIELRRGRLHLIFVTDIASDKVHIVDRDSNTVVEPSLAVGKVPKSLAVTPDGRKLFVGNEQQIPNGTISVFDVSGDEPKDFRLLSTINGVNCPEGITLSPGGDQLYVSTQCGGGKDPVFIIDTAKMAVVGSIPGLAVGTSVSVSPDGDWLYVGRGNQPCVDPDTKERGSPLSIVDVRKRQIAKTVCLRTSVGAIAVSRDLEGRYLLVANGTRLSIFDREGIARDAASLNDIPLEAGVAGMSVADDNSVYAFLPTTRRLFVASPTGLTAE